MGKTLDRQVDAPGPASWGLAVCQGQSRYISAVYVSYGSAQCL